MIGINQSDLIIPANRQRAEFEPNSLVELSTSISKNGLLHPIVVRRVDGKPTLVAGERRIRAITYLWNMGEAVRCNGQLYNEGTYPCTDIGEMGPLDAMEAELDENIKRTDLTWQERCEATSQLYELRRLQAEKTNSPMPTVLSLTADLGRSEGAFRRTKDEIVVSKFLSDPDVAGASTVAEAVKIVKQKEQIQRNIELGKSVGAMFGKHSHELVLGDSLAWMLSAKEKQFDCVVSDPPYGMNAQDFNDNGGVAFGSHFYDDSIETWRKLIRITAEQTFRLCKPQAHIYLFCDIDNFAEMKSIMLKAQWTVFRTPLIWFNPTSMRAPWPENGPQRKYQCILYAMKGKRPVKILRGDLLEYRSDLNLNHPAQKPVALYSNLLQRSCGPGDFVFDPFCGTGPIFPASHELKIKAVGIEQDEAAYGIAVNRINGLI